MSEDKSFPDGTEMSRKVPILRAEEAKMKGLVNHKLVNPEDVWTTRMAKARALRMEREVNQRPYFSEEGLERLGVGLREVNKPAAKARETDWEFFSRQIDELDKRAMRMLWSMVLLLLIAMPLMLWVGYRSGAKHTPKDTPKHTPTILEPEVTPEPLRVKRSDFMQKTIRQNYSPQSALPAYFTALHKVETGGAMNPPAGDGGDSIGPLQIQKDYWKDAGVTGSYRDCRGLAYSKRVVMAYAERYEPMAMEEGWWNELAALHNGGPSWRRNPAAARYAARVVNLMRSR